ncbi:MAG: hypothetical protein KH330_02460 [Clostridiales bacterium]|nr:hypothetical protein [Clostridiales bacterium]
MSRKNREKVVLSAYDAEIYEALQEPEIFADLFNGSLLQVSSLYGKICWKKKTKRN